MKRIAAVGIAGLLGCLATGGAQYEARLPGQAKTELSGKGPCTNFPARYQNLEERMAWFYGCMHQDPPSVDEVRAKIATLPPERRAALVGRDFPTQEALMGAAFGELPIQVFPN